MSSSVFPYVSFDHVVRCNQRELERPFEEAAVRFYAARKANPELFPMDHAPRPEEFILHPKIAEQITERVRRDVERFA